MSGSVNAPSGIDMSACTVSTDGGNTSQTLAALVTAQNATATAVATNTTGLTGLQTALSAVATSTADAVSNAANALTVAKNAQTAVGTPVQTSAAGVIGGYVAYDASSGNARIECVTPATPWVPVAAALNMNPAAVGTASSFSQFDVSASDGNGNVVTGLINCMVDTNKKINFSLGNAWGHLGPDTDGGADLATSGQAWNNCYLKTAPTVTSDANQKTVIGSLSDVSYAEGQKLLAAADAVSAKVYQLNAAIAEKGADSARHHIGYIAQEWEAALNAAGINAGDYGLLISYPLTEQQEQTHTDADGKVTTGYVTVPVYEADGKTQKLGYSLRYDELQCLLLELRKQKQIALEARVTALEAALASKSNEGTK